MRSAGNHISGKFNTWLYKEIMLKKLISPLGICILVLLALAAGFFASQNLSIVVFIAVGLLAGIIVVYYCLFKPLTGYYITTITAFFAFYPNHLLNKEIPLSTVVELLVFFVFLGTVRSAKADKRQKGNLLKASISIALLIYTLYFLMEFFNPAMDNINGWVFSIKRYAIYILIYVIAYRLINTPAKIRYFVKFWIVMSFITALYGCYQQWFGLLPMEMAYIQSDPLEFKLMSQGGMIRKFSFLSDVVSFGILSGSMAVVTLILAINEHRKKIKYLLYFFAVIMTLGMLYSGTRTTTIIIPAGISLYVFMTIRNKSTLLTLFFTVMIGFFVIFAPVDNPVLNRIRSTFDPKEASLDVRDVNRHYIQPYIYSHPIGGGIATTGVEGKNFNPNHPLAGFPPDSGLLKAALELGWIGLALTIVFYLIILFQGIHYYFQMRNEEYKKYVVAFTAALFAIIVTQYAQVSIGQIPGAFFFFSSISLFKRLLEFDEKEMSIFNSN